jgi:RNA polymerase sigma factor (sigma-70 family)
MATSGTEAILHHLRQMVVRADRIALTDGQLLEAFVSGRDTAAFESLVRRHGPMVLGVCRRILRDWHDAEDAFQASFLVLARKAASVSPRERVGNWLYGVAQMTAVRLRAANAKQRLRERQVADMPEPEAVPNELQDDLHQRLDEEVARLPEKFRVPIVLCDLEGRSRREVARQLRIPEGTLSSRLTTARRTLAKRMTSRGLVVSGGALAMALSHEATTAGVSASLVNSTVKAAAQAAAGQAAAGLISVQVAALSQGVLKAMFLTKLKTVLVFVAAVVVLGGSSLSYWSAAAEDARSVPQDIRPKLGKEAPKVDKPNARPGNRNPLIQRVYSLASLLGPKGPTEAEVNLLIRVIQGTIEPKTWSSKGGAGTIDYHPLTNALVINQSPEIQEKIQGFLETIAADTVAKEKKENKKEAEPFMREEGLWSIRLVCEHEPSKYKGIFKRILSVLAEHFEVITYANQYEGRIEASTVDAERAGIIREALVQIVACDEGGYEITVKVNKVRTAGDKSTIVGRDTDLERAILRLLGEKAP